MDTRHLLLPGFQAEPSRKLHITRTLTIVLLILCGARAGYAQADFREAYVITTGGDTLSGFADYREGARGFRVCNFKKAPSDAVVTYGPEALTGYGFVNDKYFESREMSLKENEVERVFVEVLVRGPITLYRHKDAFYVLKNKEFLALTSETREVVVNGQRMYRTNNRYLMVLSSMMADCDAAMKKVKYVFLDEKDLSNIVERYNACHGQTQVVYKEKKSWLRVYVGIQGGIQASTLKFRAYNGYQVPSHLTAPFERATSGIGGISLELNSPRVSERFGLYMELMYTQSSYTSLTTRQIGIFTERSDVQVDISQLKLPVAVRYTFPERKYTLHFNAGLCGTFHLKTSDQWIMDRVWNNEVSTYDYDAIEVSTNQIGLWGGVGLSRKLTQRLKGSAALRFEQTRGITTNMSYLLSRVQNIQFLIGLSF